MQKKHIRSSLITFVYAVSTQNMFMGHGQSQIVDLLTSLHTVKEFSFIFLAFSFVKYVVHF